MVYRLTNLSHANQSLMLRPLFTLSLCLPARAGVAADPPAALSEDYSNRVHPFLVMSCGNCHGDSPKDNDLNLKGIANASAMLAQPAVLAEIRDRVAEGGMPSKNQPNPLSRKKKPSSRGLSQRKTTPTNSPF